jgi:hypothetical protein
VRLRRIVGEFGADVAAARRKGKAPAARSIGASQKPPLVDRRNIPETLSANSTNAA